MVKKGDGQEHFSMDFIEVDGKTFVLFYDSEDNLIAEREIPYQDITETTQLNGENN